MVSKSERIVSECEMDELVIVTLKKYIIKNVSYSGVQWNVKIPEGM